MPLFGGKAGDSRLSGSVEHTPAVAVSFAPEVELEFWHSINDTSETEELNAWLTNYPNGTFKAVAVTIIAVVTA